jgi:ketosteroid isomerase-like protein
MSPTRIEAVERAYDAWNRGDLATVRTLYAPDVTADAGMLWPASGPLSGPDPIIETFASIQEAFVSCELIAEEYLVHGDTIVVPTRWRGVVEGSGTTIEQRLVANYTFRGSEITHIAYFEQLDEALAAV